jgi:proline dehydrogenase
VLASLLRRPLLRAARSPRAQAAVEAAPVSRSVVRRFVPGSGLDDAVRAASALVDEGLRVSLDHLGEETTDAGQARHQREAYLALVAALDAAGLARGGTVELSLKLSAVGLCLPGGPGRADFGRTTALAHAREVCAAAQAAGTTVTLDMEGSATTQATLDVLHELRREHPSTGAVLQAYLHRTEQDCAALAVPGSRVRLCKGAYAEPPSLAFQDRAAVDRSYVRCLRVLMAGDGYPMVATHDARLVDIATALAVRAGRRRDSYEFQMLYGVRPDAQRALAAAGETMRVYVPYGRQWYGYLVRRLAERPANTAFFLRALATRS